MLQTRSLGASLLKHNPVWRTALLKESDTCCRIVENIDSVSVFAGHFVAAWESTSRSRLRSDRGGASIL